MEVTRGARCDERDDWGLTSFQLSRVLALREAYVEGREDAASRRSIGYVFRYARKALSRHPEAVDEEWQVKRNNIRSRFDTSLRSSSDGESLQRIFDDSISLALAGVVSKEDRYVEHAGRWLRHHFLEPHARRRKELRYASKLTPLAEETCVQAIRAWRSIYYYLDAVRIVERLGGLTCEEAEGFREWLRAYSKWLEGGWKKEGGCRVPSYYAVYFYLQLASISSFLGDDEAVLRIIYRAKERVPLEFSPHGVPYEAMRSAESAHYACLVLQGWLDVATLSHRYGEELVLYSAPNGAGLRVAVDWLSCHIGFPWPYEQKGSFDADRFVPIVKSARELGLVVDVSAQYEKTMSAVVQEKPVFNPYEGVRPFWNI